MLTNVPVSNQSYFKGSTIKTLAVPLHCAAHILDPSSGISKQYSLNKCHPLLTITERGKTATNWAPMLTTRNFEQRVYAKKNLS